MADLLEGVPLPGLDPEAVRAAAVRVQRYCGWHIAPSISETVTVKLWGGVGWLPSRYVTAVSAVTVDSLAVTAFVWSEKGRLEVTGSRRSKIASVTFTHGYPECPPDVRNVVAKLARPGVAAGQVRSAQIATVQLGYFDPSAALADLDPYTLIAVA